jgi:UMF1 family MFS transporter
LTTNGAPDWNLSLAIGIGMVVVIVLGPWVGSVTDHGRRVPVLVWGTVVTITATAGLGSVGIAGSLALFSVALIAFNLAGVAYDALLPDVAGPDDIGRISGIGVGIGYLGSLIAVGLGFLVDGRGWPLERVFPLIAAGFLLFAIPSFLLIVERPRQPLPGAPPSLRGAMRHLIDSWRRAKAVPGVARFLVGRFLYTDAVNTLIGGFLTIFAANELGYDADDVNKLLAVAIVGSIAGGLVASRLVDRVGPRRYLHAMLYLWMVAMAFGIAVATIGWTRPVCAGSFCVPLEAVVLGTLGGVALAGLWSADRPYMAALTPPEWYGEFFGLYGTVGRASTLVGPALWAIVVNVLDLPRTVAMGVLILGLVAARIVLARVPRLAGT